MARINSIKIYGGTEVYTVSLVNTNPTKDSSSNPTVYDNNRHLNADYISQTLLSSLEFFCTDNYKAQLQKKVGLLLHAPLPP